MSLLKGSVIDFATELIGSSFRVVENPQVSVFVCFISYMMFTHVIRRRRVVGAGAGLAGSLNYNAL